MEKSYGFGFGYLITQNTGKEVLKASPNLSWWVEGGIAITDLVHISKGHLKYIQLLTPKCQQHL